MTPNGNPSGVPGNSPPACPVTAELERIYHEHDDDAAQRVNPHVRVCPSCQQEVQRFSELLDDFLVGSLALLGLHLFKNSASNFLADAIRMSRNKS